MGYLWNPGSGTRSGARSGWKGGVGSGSGMKGRGMRRAQASMETLSIFALLFIILIPVLFVFYSYASSAHDQMRQSQIAVIGNDIVAGAETVHYLGEPSRILLIETFPSGIIGLNASRSELWFRLSKGGEMVFFSEVNLEGSFDKADYSQGEKNILLQAGEDKVTITID